MKRATLAALSLVSAPAFAEVPAGVTTAIATMQADGVTVAVAFLVAIIAIMAVKLLRRGA